MVCYSSAFWNGGMKINQREKINFAQVEAQWNLGVPVSLSNATVMHWPGALYYIKNMFFIWQFISFLCRATERVCRTKSHFSNSLWRDGMLGKMDFPLACIVISVGAEFQITLNLHLGCAHRRWNRYTRPAERIVLNNSLSRPSRGN